MHQLTSLAKTVVFNVLLAALLSTGVYGVQAAESDRPNILFVLADDWSWPHASIAGDPVVQTPNFDRVAEEGVLFRQAYVPVPSCTPSRGSILTGRMFWELETGGNLHGTLPAKFPVYPDLFEEDGYHVGFTDKGWGPGNVTAGGRKRNPAGLSYGDFGEFLEDRSEDQPFCFWFGSRNPHRDYERRSGVESGMNLKDVEVPACLPDAETVRIDICDYYYEVQQFDQQLGRLLERLEQMGELDRTLVVVSGDNGMPFPRCKSTLYDLGTRVPLAVRWGDRMQGDRVVDDFINLADLAPTFLEAAGLPIPDGVTGRSFLNILLSDREGRVDPYRSHVITGKERHHGLCRPEGRGYPMRAIRTAGYLYIRNYKPDRWPGGSPYLSSSQGIYSDYDACPTKDYMLEHQSDPDVQPLFELGFAKRPAEELYDLSQDPGQTNNVADLPEYAALKKHLSWTLTQELNAAEDPRMFGEADAFDHYPYYVEYGVEKVGPKTEEK